MGNIVEITRGLEIGKNKIIEKNNDSIQIIFGKDISRYLIKNISYIDLVIFNKFKKNELIFQNEKLIYIDSPFIEISSTHIRHRIKEKRSFRSLLAPKVYEFIIENKLYSPELPEKVKPVIGNQ